MKCEAYHAKEPSCSPVGVAGASVDCDSEDPSDEDEEALRRMNDVFRPRGRFRDIEHGVVL